MQEDELREKIKRFCRTEEAVDNLMDTIKQYSKDYADRVIGKDMPVNFIDTGLGYKKPIDMMNHHINLEKSQQRQRNQERSK